MTINTNQVRKHIDNLCCIGQTGIEFMHVIPLLDEIDRLIEQERRLRIELANPEDADNVRVLPVITSHDVPAERILRAAIRAELGKVVILGYDADGAEYFASSVADGGTVLWLMERCKKALID